MRLVHLAYALAGLAGLAALAPAMPAEAATGNQRIGNAAIVVNAVAGVDPAQRIVQLNAGNNVYVNEVINTQAKSASRMHFLDDTSISIGEKSQVVLDKFVYDPNPGKGVLSLRLARGVIRFVTGAMAHNAYVLKTPTATIGVRGTVFNVLVGEDGSTTVTVDSGGVVMTAQNHEVVIRPGYFSTVLPGAAPTPPAALAELPPQVTQMNTMLVAAAGDKPGKAKALLLLRTLPGLGGRTTLADLLSKNATTPEQITANAIALIRQLERSNIGADPLTLQTAADLILQTASQLLADVRGLAVAKRRDVESQIEAAIASLLSRIATAAGPGDLQQTANNVTQPVPNPVVSASAN